MTHNLRASTMVMAKKDWAELNDGSPLAIVRANWDGITGDVVAVVWSIDDSLESEAEDADALKTATLLAAAPDLLEVLRQAEQRITAFSPPGYVAPEMWAIRAAIAKATGTS